jgi:hypothetical protein
MELIMATFTEGDIVGRLGSGGGMDGGLGGGLLLGLLLGRVGLFGNQDNVVTNETINQQTLGDIKASIPFNEAQVQLALAGATATVNQNINASTQNIMQNQNAFALAQANLAASLSREIGTVDTNVDRQSTVVQQAIYADGQATRALITSNRIADLEQQLTVAQLRESEQRSINREIVNTNTITIGMNQQQSQQQQQMQYLQWQLNNLLGGVGQIARATNSSVVVGSTGVGTQQTANPTNVSV